MKSIPVYEAKNSFSSLLAAVGKGEEFVVTRHGEPVARIVPVDAAAHEAGEAERARRRRAMERLLAFRASHALEDCGDVDLKAVIEEGRD